MRTDISSSEGDLATMLGNGNAVTGFHKLVYGGTGTESIADLLSTATGKDVNSILSTLQNFCRWRCKKFCN